MKFEVKTVGFTYLVKSDICVTETETTRPNVLMTDDCILKHFCSFLW